jgi:hypothetical protein
LPTPEVGRVASRQVTSRQEITTTS